MLRLGHGMEEIVMLPETRATPNTSVSLYFPAITGVCCVSHGLERQTLVTIGLMFILFLL